MSADAPATMTYVERVTDLAAITPDSTVSRTVLKADGATVVLFAFDAGQELSEHTAAVPVLIQALSGRFQVTAAERTVELVPGGLIHLDTRLPHAVLAVEPGTFLLTLLDPRSARH